jgi:hypothetical protein
MDDDDEAHAGVAELDLTAASRLIKPLLHDITGAAFALAPERAEELVECMGQIWELHFEHGRANFEALPKSQVVVASFAGLLSLWAVAAAALTLGEAGMIAQRAGESSLGVSPGSPAHLALSLKDAARCMIRDQESAWPAGLPVPRIDRLDADNEKLNNVFLGATGFVVLHEIAHILLEHLTVTPDMHAQERDADRWAFDWVMDKVSTDLEREFRMLSVTVAMTWIALVDEVRRSSSTHPHASERIQAIMMRSKVSDESAALEIATYVMKTFFDPSSTPEPAEHAFDAFADVVLKHRRGYTS